MLRAARNLKMNSLRIENTGAPVWRQIEQGVLRLVAEGALAPGELVSSVEELARALRVNPNIVARAYKELVSSGIMLYDRWNGDAQIADTTQLDPEQQRRCLRAAASSYVLEARRTGASAQEILQAFNVAIGRRLLREGTVRFETTLSENINYE